MLFRSCSSEDQSIAAIYERSDIRVMAETVQASQQDGHFNESIVNEEILEDMKKNRIDHMKYLPDMEQLEESDVMDQVISAMNAYDYDKYTEADVRRALAHDNRTPEDFKALLSPAALPLLEEIAQAAAWSPNDFRIYAFHQVKNTF